MKHKIYKVNFLTKFLILSISVLVATLFSLSLFWNSGNAIADDEVEDVANEVAADVPVEIPENVPANATPISHMPDTPGNYFLTNNVVLDSTWTAPFGDSASASTTTIDLNGYSIYSLTPINGPMISIALFEDETPLPINVSFINTNYFRKSKIWGAVNKGTDSLDITSSKGGAIYNEGLVNIENIDICYCEAYLGGAIYNTFSLNIKNCNIYENKSESGSGIFNVLNANIEWCNFYKNYANDSGAGLYESSGVVYCDHSTFNENTSSCGAAIYNLLGILNISDTKFNWNKVFYSMKKPVEELFNGKGGALAVTSGQLFINSNVEFVSNYAERSGGAVYIWATLITELNSAMFINNWCENNGGAICFGDEGEIFSESITPFTITSNYFYNNCSNKGGAIFRANSVLSLSSSTFEENKAEIGGAIYDAGMPVLETIDNTVIKNNHAGYGAAIFSAFSSFKIDGSVISNNYTWHSGTIYAFFSSYEISNTLISENYADKCCALNFVLGNLKISNLTITNNYAETFCAGIYASIIPIDMPDIDFSLSFANKNYDEDDAIVSIKDSAIFNNYGEGLVLQHVSQMLDGTISIFNNTSHSRLYTDVPTSQNRNSNLLLLAVESPLDPVIQIGEDFNTYIPIGFNIAKLDITDEGWIKLSHIEKCLTDGYSTVRGDAYITKDFVYEGYNGMQVWGDSVTGETSKEIWVDRDHKHHVMYWNDGNTLFAWCTDKDCAHHDIFTALKTTINADDAIWDGNAHGAEINDEIFRTFFWSDTPLVKYVNTDDEGAESSYDAPTEAGEYSAFLDTWFVPSISDSFIIHHENLESWMLDPQKVTMSYNGEEQSPVFTLKDGSRDIFENVELSGDLSATEIGDYQIVITGKDDNIKYGGQIVLNWHITGDPQPVPPTPVDPDNPGGGGSAQTGDSTGIALAIASMLALCGASAAGACAKRRKFDK